MTFREPPTVGTIISSAHIPDTTFEVTSVVDSKVAGYKINLIDLVTSHIVHIQDWEWTIEDSIWSVVTSKKQIGGTHYPDLDIQPWEVIKRNKMGFFDGTALKYIMRYRQKNGVEDLKKAIHTLEELISQLENENA